MATCWFWIAQITFRRGKSGQFGVSDCLLAVTVASLARRTKKKDLCQNGTGLFSLKDSTDGQEVGLVCEATNLARRFFAQQSSVCSLHTGISSP